MTTPKPHKCTEAQFVSLHQAIDETRPSTQLIKVDRQALVNLLLDHAVLQSGEKLT